MTSPAPSTLGRHPVEHDPRAQHPWPALWALVVGFFMILVDSTIVSVALPHIMSGLQAGIAEVVWVSSAYLLAYAVPLLMTGRLGDRFGPKPVYLTGLVIFTASSAWCGMATTVGALVTARVAQGLGASLMTPQTMAVITRLFPPHRRGAAMGLWGGVAGAAVLVGPILGGLLTDSVGWRWIFYVNVPVGVVALAAVSRLVPRLTTHTHSFDWLGVALSGAGLFLLVFGIQEGQSHAWGAIWGPVGVWHLVAAGVLLMAAFAWWQAHNQREPLIPLRLFQDRNFSLANAAIAAVGFTITAMSFPLMLFFQAVRGMSPTQAALLLVPMAVLSGGLSPLVGRHLERLGIKRVGVAGLVLVSIALWWYSRIMTPDTPTWAFLLPSAVMGLANGFMWGPLSVTATRNLPAALAGAGSGVYNATRQMGAVLGSAAVAATMENRVSAHLPAAPGGASTGMGTSLPGFLQAGFAAAMSETLLVPAAVILLGALAALFFAPAAATGAWGSAGSGGSGSSVGSVGSVTPAAVTPDRA